MRSTVQVEVILISVGEDNGFKPVEAATLIAQRVRKLVGGGWGLHSRKSSLSCNVSLAGPYLLGFKFSYSLIRANLNNIQCAIGYGHGKLTPECR